MSGYLQRLAGSAAQPSQRVHPMVGSMFAPSTPELGDESGMQSEMSDTTLTNSESRSTSHRVNLDFELSRSDLSQQPDKTRQDTPTRSYSASGDEEETDKQASTKSRPSTPHDVESQQSLIPPPYSPLLPPKEQRPALLPNAATPARPSRGSSPAASQASHREPDDIQIHIGRVEVLAVAQPQPQSTPKVTRKSTSLDDYLRRRDGRSQ